MTSIILPHRRKAFQPAGGTYVGVQPDIGVICNDGSGTAVAVELPGGASDLTADADEWLTIPTRYNCNEAQSIETTAGQFNSILDNLTDQLTIFCRCSHPSSWNVSSRTIAQYGPSAGAHLPLAFRFEVDKNNTNGQYRMALDYTIATSTGTVLAQVDYGADAQSGEHSVAMVYDGTDVQFYLDGSTHGSAQSLTGDFDSPASAGKILVLGSQLTGALMHTGFWDGGIRDWRLALTALSAAEISTWDANPAT